MKKLLSVLFALVLCFAMFAGCTYVDPNTEKGQGDQATIDSVDTNAGEELSGVLRIAAPDVASHKNALDAFINSYKLKFPKVEVEVTYLDFQNYKNAITTAVSSAEGLNKPSLMYDVFWLAQVYINEWLQGQDFLSPITPMIDKDDSFTTEGINKQMLDMGSVNGQLYMMPRDYNQVVMYYNKEMFDLARVDYPSDDVPMTGAEFKQMLINLANNLAKVSKNNDYGVAYQDAVKAIVDCNIKWESLDYPLVRSFGGEVADKDGNIIYNSDATEAALGYWNDLVNTTYGRAKLAIGLNDGINSGRQFRAQNSAIYFHTRATLSDLINEEDNSGNHIYGIPNLGVAPLPNFGGTYAVGAGCSGYAMYKKAANATAAYQFLKHVVSIEGQQAYSATGDCVPVLESLLHNANAVWRNCRTDKLGADFNHNAFIYAMDTAACSVYDFYQYVPFKAQATITACIEESFQGYIANAAGRNAISDSVYKMNTAIQQAKN